jgi:hypothetical protein
MSENAIETREAMCAEILRLRRLAIDIKQGAEYADDSSARRLDLTLAASQERRAAELQAQVRIMDALSVAAMLDQIRILRNQCAADEELRQAINAAADRLDVLHAKLCGQGAAHG